MQRLERALVQSIRAILQGGLASSDHWILGFCLSQGKGIGEVAKTRILPASEISRTNVELEALLQGGASTCVGVCAAERRSSRSRRLFLKR